MTGTCDALDARVLDAVDPTDVTVGENWIQIQRGVKYPLSDFLPLSPSSVPEKVRREGEGLQSISDRGSLSLSLFPPPLAWFDVAAFSEKRERDRYDVDRPSPAFFPLLAHKERADLPL